jgi:hypothetical protein
MVYASNPEASPGWGGAPLDIIAILGCILVFVGYLIQKVSSGPLVAVHDPYMHEGLEHKNYV